MKSRRLNALLAVMAAMLIARLWIANSKPEALVVDAAVRPTLWRTAEAPASRPASDGSPLLNSTNSSIDDEALAGNPFAVRHPLQTATPAVQQPMPVVAPVLEPPQPDPAPPFQPIGTYDDRKSPGVFVATPGGVEVARVGGLVGAEFRVIAISRQSVTIEQITSKRQFVLPMPTGGTP